MKILHINNFYHKAGGTEIYIDRVSRQLENLGHNVSILYGVPAPSNTEVINCNSIFLSNVHSSGDYTIINSAMKIIEREKFDIVYLHNVFNTVLIDNLLKILPVLKFVHEHSLYCPGGAKYLRLIKKKCNLKYHPVRCFLMAYLTHCAPVNPVRLRNRISQSSNDLTIGRTFNSFLVFSQAMRENLKINGIEDEKITVTNHFTSPISNKGNKDFSMLLYVGRISREKGVDYLLKVLEGLKTNYRLVIIGDGYYLPNIKRLANQLEIINRVEFKGWLSESELSDYYSRAAVLIFPSLWPEPFGISGIEAMAHGIPVVAFNTGAVSEWLIDNETGFLVETGDIIGMRKKVELLLHNTKLAFDMGVKGKTRVEKYFTIERHIRDLFNATSDAIKRYNIRTGKSDVAVIHKNLYRDSEYNVRSRFDNDFEKASSFYSRYIKFILQHVHKYPAKILDVGCGSGWSTQLLRKEGHDAIGLDLHISALESNNFVSRFPYFQADVQCLPFSDSSFDIVAMHSVLEHLQDPKHALNECLRILKDHGRLIIVGPNLLGFPLNLYWSIKHTLRCLKSGRLWEYRGSNQSRHPGGNTMPEAWYYTVHHLWHTFSKLFIKKEPCFLMRIPDTNPPFHADNDSTWYCNPMDILNWTKETQDIQPIHWWADDRFLARFLWPFAGGTWIVLEKVV